MVEFLRVLRVGFAEGGSKPAEARRLVPWATVFGDRLSKEFPDPEHSQDKERYIIIGMSQRGRILVVAHTEEEDTIRIISARRATRHERRFYEEEKLEKAG